MSNLTVFQNFIHLSRYARYIPEKQRRETWEETVTRYFDFFETFLKENNDYTLTKELRSELQTAVLNLDVMPSMRCLMTAGEALRTNNIAGYNCSFVAIDTIKTFGEIMYILMSGVGVGFTVESVGVGKLPEVPEELHSSDSTIHVADSRLGWAKGLTELISLLYSGNIPRWDFSKIRPAGAVLKTFGGRASGPKPLEDLFLFIIKTFKGAKGRKLTTLECHDIICMIGESVVAGGSRRSALISLSDLTDDRMRNAKNGAWWNNTPYRSLANNSAVYNEKKPTVETFLTEWKSLYDSKSGERGIFSRYAAKAVVERSNEFRKSLGCDDFRFRDTNYEFGTNPCSEIILRDKQFCNLSEVVIRSSDGPADLCRKVRIATILGTFQSCLTNFKFLEKKWTRNTEDERLLGVSLTGIMDNSITSGQNDNYPLNAVLSQMRQVAIETNAQYAKEIGIPMATAITAVKPSGCTTLDTEIKTSCGNKSMAEIFTTLTDVNIFECVPGTWLSVKEKMYVFDESNQIQEITKLFINGISEVFEIEDENGEIYKFTGNHELKTTNGWKHVNELTEQDQIIDFNK